jgi:hypothetical protein
MAIREEQVGVDHAAVRDLCRQIAQETDPEKVHHLLVSLRTAPKAEQKAEQEEARLRMSQTVRHYLRRISEPAQHSTRTEPLVFEACAAGSRWD